MALDWIDIEPAAAGMFRIWTSGGDLAFAKEAWTHLAAAGLTDDDTPLLATQAQLRLIAIYRIYERFSRFKWDEGDEMPIVFLAEGMEVDRLALGLLAAADRKVDWPALEGIDMYEEALRSAVDSLRPSVFECLRKAYRGDTGLYVRLSRTRSNDPEDDDNAFDLTGLNVDAYAFVRFGGDP